MTLKVNVPGLSYQPLIWKYSYLVPCMAGLHSTTSDAWLHAIAQILGHLKIFRSWGNWG